MKEEVFRYGEGNSGFGMITLPPEDLGRPSPMIVLFNAGVLHREAPYRLNVLICRALAQYGFKVLRVDLAGNGDSSAREGLPYRESVALDWKYIKQSITSKFGPQKYILGGLCSGADNAIKLTANDSDIYGLILLDCMTPKDKGFHIRALLSKITNPYRWRTLPNSIKTKIIRRLGGDQIDQIIAELRDLPTHQDLIECITNIKQNKGRVLAIFTSQATFHYNQEGQFAKALNDPEFGALCKEIYLPMTSHLFEVNTHRKRLLKSITDWGEEVAKEMCNLEQPKISIPS